MTKLQKITSKEKEEKELALSLFRIPINFFAEDKKSPDVKSSSSSNDMEVKENNDSSTSTPPDQEIKLSKDNPSATINLEFDDVESATKKISKEDKVQELKEKFTPVEKLNATKDHLTYKAQNSKVADTLQDVKDKLAVPKEKLNDAKDKLNATKDHLKYAAGDKIGNSKPAQKAQDLKDKLAKPGEKLNDAKDKINAKKDDLRNKANDKLKDSKPAKKAQELKDKYSPRKKIDNARDKINAKKDDLKNKTKDRLKNSKAGQKANDLKDKIKNNPAVSKALNGVNKVKELKDKANATKDAIQSGDTNKLVEAGADAAAEIASHGGAVARGIAFAYKSLDKTKTGKSIKKYLIGCLSVAIVVGTLMTILVLLLPTIWISNLFGGLKGRNAISGELSEEEFAFFQDAAKAYSMEAYEDFTTELNNPGWWKELWGTDSKYPIQESLETYLKNYYYYDERLIKEYTDSLSHKELKIYKKLVDANYLPRLNEGDLTSFGLSFEMLISHYDLNSLKSPGSSPQRDKAVDDKNITYYLETNGTHMQLFEDVLNSTDPDTMNDSNNLLVSRFNGQVDEKWFIDDTKPSDFSNWLNSPDKDAVEPDWYNISLATVLNTSVKNVYIPQYDEDNRELSLRDLLKETSTNSYDSQYYTSLVKSILNDSSHIGNIKLKTLFTQLTRKLASLELMTYMLYYQKYEKTIDDFITSIKKYDNSDRFSKNFFEQFLTFSHVQHFIALSNTTNAPSLAYEIAVASFETVSESIKTEVLPNNYVGIKQFTNWYATYHFENSVYATNSGSYNFYMTISDVTPTYTQQYLFDKYNITHGIYDEYEDLSDEEKAELNKNSFFEVFEATTGIDTAFDANGNISIRMPGGIRTTSGDYSISYDCAPGKFFPIDSNAPAYVSLGFGDYYSEETLAAIGRTENRPEGHHGIDYAILQGTEIFAVSSGTVVFAGYEAGYGNYVKIVHDDGYVSIYAHGNGTFHVKAGDHVEAGPNGRIMQSGNSGSSSGAHLHFEMYDPNGVRINPNDYLYGIL